MKIRMIATAAAVVISAPAGFGQSTAADPFKKIDELFAKSTIDTPGCAVGVAQKGKTVVERAYGAAVE